ncbi:MAG: chemotaxis protein [Candidatus Woesearchaeota archaeon]
MADTKILLESGTNELEIAEFIINMKSGRLQSFGINVAKVREIIIVPPYEEIPHAHPCVMGVFKLRDKVIPLIDLSKYLDEGKPQEGAKCKVIVTEFNQQNFGFLIHDIATIHRISWKRVLPPSEVVMDINKSCITSVVPFDDKIVFMLDFEKIVSDINPSSSLNSTAAQKEVEQRMDTTYNVLFADDSSTIREAVTSILTKGGFKVHTVNDGEAAWTYLTEKKDKYKTTKTIDVDLIITDIEMPRMDGHALCKKIKTDNTLNNILVILFSSLIYEELKRKGEAVGADAQISKPELDRVVIIAKDLITKSKLKENQKLN